MNRSSWWFLVSVALLAARPARAAPAYNRIEMNLPHNSMQKWQDPQDILFFYNIRGFEWDLHPAVDEGITDDWRIYHTGFPSAYQTHCYTLGDCLRMLQGFHELVPKHEVITIYLDDHEIFSASDSSYPTTTTMDNLIDGILGHDQVFTPSDLLARCPGAATLQAAVQQCGWPTTDELRGKFIFLIGSKMYDYNDKVDGVWIGPDATQLRHDLFAMPDCPGPIACPSATPGTVTWNMEADPQIVFYNFNNGDFPYYGLPLQSVIDNAAASGVVTRVYGADDGATVASLKQVGVNIISGDTLDDENDPFAGSTASFVGWPFTCVPGSSSGCDLRSEATNRTVTIRNNQGDALLFQQHAALDDAISGAIGLPYTHDLAGLDQSGHACIVARASVDGGHLFEVCRGNDTDPAFVLFDVGAGTQKVQAQLPAGGVDFYSGDNRYAWGLVKISFLPLDGGGVQATGWTCDDNEDCSAIASIQFSGDTLPIRGDLIHDTAATFTNVTLGGDRLVPGTGTFHDFTGNSAIAANMWAQATAAFSSGWGAVGPGEWYRPAGMSVPPGGVFFADLEGVGGNADLFVDQGTAPTDTQHLCSSASSTSSDHCHASATTPGMGSWMAGALGVSGAPWLYLQDAVMAYTMTDASFDVVANGYWNWTVCPQPGQNLRIASQSSSDVGLFAAQGRWPTPTDFDASSDWAGTGNEALHLGHVQSCVHVRTQNRTGSTAHVRLVIDAD